MICNVSFIPCLLNTATRKNRGKKHLKDVLENIFLHQGSVIEQNIVYSYIPISYYSLYSDNIPIFASSHLNHLLTINKKRHEKKHERMAEVYLK